MQKYTKVLGFGHNTTTLIISNGEIEDIIKIVKSLEDSGLLLKGVNETIQNKAKKQKGEFLGMLCGTLGANLLQNMLTGRGILRIGYGFERSSIKDLQSKDFQLKKRNYKS